MAQGIFLNWPKKDSAFSEEVLAEKVKLIELILDAKIDDEPEGGIWTIREFLQDFLQDCDEWRDFSEEEWSPNLKWPNEVYLALISMGAIGEKNPRKRNARVKVRADDVYHGNDLMTAAIAYIFCGADSFRPDYERKEPTLEIEDGIILSQASKEFPMPSAGFAARQPT